MIQSIPHGLTFSTKRENQIKLSTKRDLTSESISTSMRKKNFSLPPTSLMRANYERMAAAFDCQGYLARSVEEIKESVQSALAEKSRPSIINVLIDPSSGRVQQVSFIFPNQ